jgi:hypothetical protein
MVSKVIIKGVVKLFETLIDYAEEEYYSKTAIKKRLMELDILYEDGEISMDEYEELQNELLETLLEIKPDEGGDQYE